MIVTYGSENKHHKLIFNKLSCYPQESLHLEEHFSFDLVAQSLSWFLFKRFCTFSFVIFFFTIYLLFSQSSAIYYLLLTSIIIKDIQHN